MIYRIVSECLDGGRQYCSILYVLMESCHNTTITLTLVNVSNITLIITFISAKCFRIDLFDQESLVENLVFRGLTTTDNTFTVYYIKLKS